MEDIKLTLISLYTTIQKNKNECIPIFDNMLNVVLAAQRNEYMVTFCFNVLLSSCNEIYELFKKKSDWVPSDLATWGEWNKFVDLVTEYVIEKLKYCRTCKSVENLHLCTNCRRYYCSIKCKNSDESKYRCRCDNFMN